MEGSGAGAGAGAGEAERGGASQSGGGLTVGDVDRALTELAATTGSGSVGERARIIDGLLAGASRGEIDFIADLLTGGLRQGALEGVMAEAGAKAAGVPGAG